MPYTKIQIMIWFRDWDSVRDRYPDPGLTLVKETMSKLGVDTWIPKVDIEFRYSCFRNQTLGFFFVGIGGIQSYLETYNLNTNRI